MDINRVSFESLANGGDDVTGALVKLDHNVQELADAVGGNDDGIGSITDRVTGVEDRVTIAEAQLSGLKGASKLDVGTTANSVAAGNDARFAYIPPSFWSGVELQWVSASAITVSAGAFWVPSLSAVVRFAAPIAKAGLALAASTMYHIYGFVNAANPDVEIVTTAPSAPYFGRARTKSGDTSRRYLGSFYTNASGAIARFRHDVDSGYIALTDPVRERSRQISNGIASAAEAQVSFAGIIPLSSQRVQARYVNLAATGGAVVFIGNPDIGATANNAGGIYLASVSPQVDYKGTLELSVQQVLSYRFNTTTSSGLYVDVEGYYFSR